jgi:quinolinate synthase
VCTSTNAPTILDWAFARREKVLFFPDQHLGRWTGFKKGIPLDEMVVWDPDLEYGGLTREQIRNAKILLWKGHCSVHQMFQPAHIIAGATSTPTVWSSRTRKAPSKCAASPITSARPSTSSTPSRRRPGHQLAGGHRAEPGQSPRRRSEAEGKIVQFMAPTVCMCSTMQRIDPQHLAWTLENLADGKVVNRISVPEHEATLAKLAWSACAVSSIACACPVAPFFMGPHPPHDGKAEWA